MLSICSPVHPLHDVFSLRFVIARQYHSAQPGVGTLGVSFWSSADPTLGRYLFPLQNKVPSPFPSCPLPPTPARRHYCYQIFSTANRISSFTTTTTPLQQYLKGTHLAFYPSTSTIPWLEAKAKVLVEREAAQRIRVRRVRNLIVRRLACRSVFPLFCISISLSMRLWVCDSRLHRHQIRHSTPKTDSTRFENIRLC